MSVMSSAQKELLSRIGREYDEYIEELNCYDVDEIVCSATEIATKFEIMCYVFNMEKDELVKIFPSNKAKIMLNEDNVLHHIYEEWMGAGNTITREVHRIIDNHVY